MKIGIDIDGVLNSQYNFCIDYGTKFCNEIGKYKLENVHAIDTTDMFLWGDEVAHKFWNKYRKDLVITLPAKKYASEVIEKLKSEGNKIYIITARRNGDEWFPDDLKNDVEKITKNWLKENNINIMIEDDPINLRKLLSNTNILVFDYPYNRNKEFFNLTRVYSWYDTYYRIKCIKE